MNTTLNAHTKRWIRNHQHRCMSSLEDHILLECPEDVNWSQGHYGKILDVKLGLGEMGINGRAYIPRTGGSLAITGEEHKHINLQSTIATAYYIW